jgi:hypothetical protein
MFDSVFFGKADFSACQGAVACANRVAYKNCKNWSLPKWELLKKMYPFDRELNFPSEGLMWTDNASDAAFTAKKLDLSNGNFINCSLKEEYADPALLRMYSNSSYDDVDVHPIKCENFSFIMFSLEKHKFEELDIINNALSKIRYLGIDDFQRPGLAQLCEIYEQHGPLTDDADAWFWTTSEGGNFKAHCVNMATGEIYACKKMSDYRDRMACSLSVIDTCGIGVVLKNNNEIPDVDTETGFFFNLD